MLDLRTCDSVIREEKLSENLDQAKPMFSEHWIELYGNDFDSDISGMIEKNRSGEMVYFTLKNGEELLAHMGYFIITAPLYRAKIALDMFYFVKPKARGTMKCVRLLKESAQMLLASGVSSVLVSQMNNVRLGKIIHRAGFVAKGETFTFKG
jgi:hypothetical protein